MLCLLCQSCSSYNKQLVSNMLPDGLLPAPGCMQPGVAVGDASLCVGLPISSREVRRRVCHVGEMGGWMSAESEGREELSGWRGRA